MHKQPDQAAGIRKMNKMKPVRVIAVTSGKGGVGKTNLSVNVGIALSQIQSFSCAVRGKNIK